VVSANAETTVTLPGVTIGGAGVGFVLEVAP
jgi:hypothetical protein